MRELRHNSKLRRKKYAAFVVAYRPRCYYYEEILMARRIVLLLVYAFPKAEQVLLRGIISFLCTIILAIHVKTQPFINPLNNWLETALLLLLCLVSTLSTISSETSTEAISITISILSALPLLPLPFLAFKYCKRRVVPKIKKRRMVAASKAGGKIEDNYVPPTALVANNQDVDEDVGNNTVKVEDDDLL